MLARLGSVQRRVRRFNSVHAGRARIEHLENRVLLSTTPFDPAELFGPLTEKQALLEAYRHSAATGAERATVQSGTGLLALYRFEDASGAVGATIHDSSRNGFDGTVLNGAVGLVPGRNGFGSAASFPGGPFTALSPIIHADVSAPEGTTVNDFAVALWMKANAHTGQYLVSRTTHVNDQLAVIYGSSD